ncbi:MAG: Tn3 family transposase [Nannocystales bacterium]
MPVEFLTDEQEAAYGGFSEPPSRSELERFFYLDDEARQMVDQRRGDHNRLGFGVQLGTVRMLGRFLDDAAAAPEAAINYVAEQLHISDPACIELYGERPKTVLEHEWKLREAYGYRDFAAAETEIETWLDARAWTTGEGPKALFDATVEKLREEKVLLPGLTPLARFVARVREQAEAKIWAALFDLTTKEQRHRLDGLLDVEEDAFVSLFERLRKGPTRASGTQFKGALARVAEIEALGFTDVDCSVVPPRRLMELARYGRSSKASYVRRHPPRRRYATMLATVVHLRERAIDDALDVFDALMATRLVARAKRETTKDRASAYPTLAIASSKLAIVARALRDANADASASEIREALAETVDPGALDEALATVASMTPAEDSDLHEEMRAKLVQQYRVVRPFLAPLAEGLEFTATAEGAPLLAAMKKLPSLFGRKKVPREEVDETLLAGSWRHLVLRAPALEAGEVDWRAYVLCVLEQFWRHLLRRDISAVHSSRWSDPRAKLLAGDEWTRVRPTVLASLDLPETPDEHLNALSSRLDEAYRIVGEQLEDDGGVTVDEDGQLRFEALAAESEPPSLIALRAAVKRMLPQVELPEVLLEVAMWTGFHQAFTPLGESASRVKDLELSIAALLVAQACNIGFRPVAKEGVSALSRARLSHLEQTYLRVETIKRANQALLEGQDKIPLVRAWGGGHVASVDGLRFVVPVATIHARPNPRYFGRRAGATWLNMLNDHAAGLAAKVVAGTPRDSLHVLDVLNDQDGGVRPQVIVTDTSSYSDIVFGLLSLSGRTYAPQLADLPDQKLWRVNRNADYGSLSTAARGRISVSKITRHWPDILRVVASIHTGTVRSYDIIRMLQRDGRPTPLGVALAHYGRIHKSLHVLRLASDRGYRRQIKVQANLQEGRHDLARRLFHGERGELRQRYRDGMEDQLGALGLVLNIIVLFNTRYMNAALEKLRVDGFPVDEQDVARLSPLMRKHINIQGHYAFAVPNLGGRLRALQSPDRELDDDT